MKIHLAIFLASALASAILAGCDRGAQVGVGVVNKTGMMMTNCIVRFAEGNLNTGVVLTNARRNFSYFDTPISESANIDVVFPDGAKRNMKAYIGSTYNRDRPGTLVFEVGPEAVRVLFERAK